MKATDLTRARELIDRIGRVAAADEWSEELNPAQRSALAYLSRANVVSRAPSNVADYLCTTRGTASQTLKALTRKGLISQTRSTTDRRSISYDITAMGRAALGGARSLDEALEALPASDAGSLTASLEAIGLHMLEQRGYRTFGVCATCRHHLRTDEGLRCGLLAMRLSESDAQELCHEHAPRS